MSSDYNFNAPQFVAELDDIITLSDGEEDNFFDATGPQINEEKEVSLPSPDTENKENVGLSEDESLNSSFSSIKIRNKFDGIDLTVDEDRKVHPMLTRQDVSIMSPKLSLQLRSRSVLKEVVDIPGFAVCGLKRKADGGSKQLNSVAKYRSLAEAIYHFQRDTPPRFRSKSKKSSGFKFSLPQDHHVHTVTVPETPHFLSGQRLRHCSQDCLTQEERDIQQIEKAKQQFKPQHLNMKIFDPLQEVPRDKHFTIPRPFKLTEQPQKKVEGPTKEEVFVFKAKPLPRSTYLNRDRTRVSTNRLPVLNEDSDESEEGGITAVIGIKEANPSSKTIVQPFSFDERDKLMAKRKLEKINQIIEDEKKGAVFFAQPLPSYLTDLHNASDNCSCSSTTSSSHRHESEELNREFRARPASVLHKKPFQLNKCCKNPTKVLDIHLNTEMRAKQRTEFNQQLKCNQMERDLLDQQIDELEEMKAQAEVARLRKELVHKPLPVPRAVRSFSKTSLSEDCSDSS